MTRDTYLTRRRLLVGVGATLAAGVPTVSSATADTGDGAGIFADGVGDSGDAWAFFRGYFSRYQSGLSAPPSPETLADRMRNEFNANAEAWLSYGNWLVDEHDVSIQESATVQVDVKTSRVRWPFRSPAKTSTAIHVDSEDGEYTDVSWIEGQPDDADYRVEIRNRAAEHAADELQTFRLQYIDGDHELPDSEYLSRVAGRHASNIGLGEDSKHALSLLLGDPDDG